MKKNINTDHPNTNVNASKRYGNALKTDYFEFVFNYIRALNRILESPEIIENTGVDLEGVREERKYFKSIIRHTISGKYSANNAIRYIYNKNPHVFGAYIYEIQLYLRNDI